jgi:hypothetical protein
MTTANYIEYYVIPEDLGMNVYKVDLGLEKFTSILKLMSTREDLKFFQKSYKEYNYGDIIYQNYDNTETRVFRKVPISSVYDNHVLKVACQRQKLSIINVPSNTAYKEIYTVNHLIFRITNRIFLNMLVKRSSGAANHVSYSVYVNYNHDDGVDCSQTEGKITEILDLILAAPTY